MRRLCHYCDRPLHDVKSSVLEILTRDGWHPCAGEDLVAQPAHWSCVPEDGVGYWIDFGDLLRDGIDGPQGWREHMRRKVWWDFHLDVEVCAAHQAAGELRAAESRNAGALARAATRTVARPPRAPRNPRNISTKLRTFVLERDGFRCRRCGCGPSDGRLVIDHIVPVAAGGTGDAKNLQVLCEPCNAGKAARAPHAHDRRPLGV